MWKRGYCYVCASEIKWTLLGRRDGLGFLARFAKAFRFIVVEERERKLHVSLLSLMEDSDFDASLLFGPPDPDFNQLIYGPLNLHITQKDEGRAAVRQVSRHLGIFFSFLAD
jgi:hypothetical protein